MAVKVPSLVLIVLLVDFATAGVVWAAGDCAAAVGAGVAGIGAATGAVAGATEEAAGAAGAAGAAAAGLAEGVTSLFCDQAPLVGRVMSADSNKIREMCMAKSLNGID